MNRKMTLPASMAGGAVQTKHKNDFAIFLQIAKKVFIDHEEVL
jgi:hypothetical protein